MTFPNHPDKFASTSPALTARLTQALAAGGHVHPVGASWTIDAPYRETRAEVQRYQSEGIACVEMEAAALFAVAQYRNVERGAMFTITDSLASLEWHPEFHNERARQGLETLYQTALACLTSPAQPSASGRSLRQRKEAVSRAGHDQRQHPVPIPLLLPILRDEPA